MKSTNCVQYLIFNFLVVIFLSLQNTSVQGQVRNFYMVDLPSKALPNRCYTYCLDRQQIGNDSIADFIQVMNDSIYHRPTYLTKMSRTIVKAVGIKKKKSTVFPSKRALKRIAYDTLIQKYMAKQPLLEWKPLKKFRPSIQNPTTSKFCQPTHNQDCWTFCLVEIPVVWHYAEKLQPITETLPKYTTTGKRLGKDEEWVIEPITQEVPFLGVMNNSDYECFFLGKRSQSPEIQEKLIALNHIAREKAYTDWLGFDCLNLNDSAPNEIPYLALSLYKKGYAKRKIVNQLDAQFIKDLLQYQEENGLVKGLLDKATLDSLNMDKK